MATIRWREAIAVGIGQRTNNKPINHANLFGSVRYRCNTNTKPRIVKNNPTITVINTQPIGRILAASGKSKKGNACKNTNTLNSLPWKTHPLPTIPNQAEAINKTKWFLRAGNLPRVFAVKNLRRIKDSHREDAKSAKEDKTWILVCCFLAFLPSSR